MVRSIHLTTPYPQPLTFVEIDYEIISTAFLLPSADSRRVFVSYKRKYVHKVLVIRLLDKKAFFVYTGKISCKKELLKDISP